MEIIGHAFKYVFGSRRQSVHSWFNKQYITVQSEVYNFPKQYLKTIS